MRETSILDAMQELTTAATAEGIHAVMHRHPVLLERASVAYLRRLAAAAAAQDDVDLARALDRQAVYLERVQAAICRTLLQDNPVAQIAEQLVSNNISWDDAKKRLGSPEITSRLREKDVKTVDLLVGMILPAETEVGIAMARLNFVAAQRVAGVELVKASGVKLLDALPHSSAWMVLRAEVDQELLSWIEPDRDLRFWATIMADLATAYQALPAGDRAENLERAIQCAEGALHVFTRDSDPEAWATTMIALGTAFKNRIRGIQAENIEKGIQYLQAAIEVLTATAFPQEHAGALINLALGFKNRIRGERAANIEKAIHYFQAALQIFTREQYPHDWGIVMHNLGIAWSDRISGDRSDNIERAIACYQSALEVRTREASPEEWSMTTFNLGVDYTRRMQGEREANLEQAIQFYHSALQVRTRESFPYEWAMMMSSLGSAYAELPEKDDNIERAIESYRAALQVYTVESSPQEWARTMANLGTDYLLRVKGDPEENIERAIGCFEATLAVRTPEHNPEQWSATMHDLGIAYESRRRGSRDENLQRAVYYLQGAGAMRARLGLSFEALQSFGALGHLLFRSEKYSEGIAAYSSALEQMEHILTEVLSLDRRAQILRDSVPLFDRAIICLVRMGQIERALELAERGKSRTLIDLLSYRDLRPKNTPPHIVRAYERLLLLGRESKAEPSDGLEELLATIRQYDPDFLPSASPLDSGQIKHLAAEAEATLLLFRVTEAGTFIFAVSPPGRVDLVEVADFTRQALSHLLLNHDVDRAAAGWIGSYYAYQTAPSAGREDARKQWLQQMDGMLQEIYQRLLKPVREILRETEASTRVPRRVVMAPNLGLAVLPLHACWWMESGVRRHLMDDMVVTYTPSLSVFKLCIRREKIRPKTGAFLGIANPAPGDLKFAEWECGAVTRLLEPESFIVLKGDQATREQVLRSLGVQNILHFACHGVYQLDSPMNSSLQFANQEKLTLGEILETVDLPHSWLAVLSACETALSDFGEIADEHYGLPLGFLFAGAPTVWGTLWTVDDPATALLMSKAYEGLIRGCKSKPDALREAQFWLRSATAAELVDLLSRSDLELEDTDPTLRTIRSLRRDLRYRSRSDDRPYAHPYFWAAVQCVGA